jgi:hypothetical protein
MMHLDDERISNKRDPRERPWESRSFRHACGMRTKFKILPNDISVMEKEKELDMNHGDLLGWLDASLF